VDLAAVLRTPLAVRRRVVRLLHRRAAGRGGALDARHVDAVVALLRRAAPGRVALPGGVEARVRYGRLELAPPAAPAPPVAPLEIVGPGVYPVAGRGVAVEIEGAPAAASYPLVLRSRRPGDRFRPAGGRGGRSLKRWLIDRKIPREDRDGLLVVADRGQVLAIPELAAVADGVGAAFRVRIRAGP
jgi:tRNA(Ile)-lysidine synthase